MSDIGLFFFSDESASLGGELIFGGVDSSKYTGSITYVPVAIEQLWEFQLTRYYFHQSDSFLFIFDDLF